MTFNTLDVMATSVAAHIQTHSPVDADSTQVEDTGSAHHHIQRDKDVTVEPAEEPGTANHLHVDKQAD